MKPTYLTYFLHLPTLILFASIISQDDSAISQVIPDETLGDESSVVNPRNETSDSIDGGAIRGQNLFHSFQEFNVDAGRGVYFKNPNAVTNIFSRVTGNNVSNILGTLGVDGVANLFLINPNGIIFGADASLDLEGFFAATTASGIEFGERGLFSAVNPQTPQLLTINPSAFFYNQLNAGTIINNSVATAGLSVPDGKSLILLGGNVVIDKGSLNAVDGSIELGGLLESGRVELNIEGDNLSLNFPEDVAKGDVVITNDALVNVSGTTGGDIFIRANDLEISEASLVIAGIAEGLVTESTQAKDIRFEVDRAIAISNSTVQNLVAGEGSSGEVAILADESISVDNSHS